MQSEKHEFDIQNNTSTHNSMTAAMMEAVTLYGVTNIKDYCMDPENRPGITQDEFQGIADRLITGFKEFAKDTRLEDEIMPLVSGFCTSVFYRLRSLKTRSENLSAALVIARQDSDGSEIGNNNIEDQLSRLKDIDQNKAMMETLHQVLIGNMMTHFSEAWTAPGGGSYTSRARKYTSAFIEAGDYINARKKAETDALNPEGTFIAFAGASNFADDHLVWKALDRMKAEYPDMVLVHTGCTSGGDIAADKWALVNKVHRIAVKPKFDEFGSRRAPFERNRLMLREFDIAALIVTPGPGYIENLVDAMRGEGRRVIRIGLPKTTTANTAVNTG